MSKEPFKVAAIEFNAGNESLEENVEGAVAMAREAAENGARLIVLPEVALSGMKVVGGEISPFLDTIPGKMTDALEEVTAGNGCYVVCGISELQADTGLSYNSAALVGPDGYIGKYRKNGLNSEDQVTFAPGNTGYPVFETELGRIAMLICYDDTYWEPARIVAIKGADIIAFPVAAFRAVEKPGKEAPGDHSTIAADQEMCAWNGLALVAADRNSMIQVSPDGAGMYSGGASSIWQADGRKIAQTATTDPNVSTDNPGQILYGEIDPSLFDNDQKATIEWRRPELYGDLAILRAPTDPKASTESHQVRAAAVQVEQTPGDRGACQSALQEATGPLPGEVDLVVLPAFTYTGPPTDASEATELAEEAGGPTEKEVCKLADELSAHVVASHVEDDGGSLYHRAILVGPDGKLIGAYRQTHLDPDRSAWASEGDDLPVFDTAIGRIGMLLCEDTRLPEAAGVLEVRRADIIAIPTWWDGSYGGPLQEATGLFQVVPPENTMCLWYAIAKMAQAYTVVANSVGNGAKGDSGIFTINPVDSEEAAVTAPSGEPGVARLTFQTLGDPTWWMNQHLLICGRRADLVAPITFPKDSEAFKAWEERPGYPIEAWAAYDQQARD